MKNALLVVPLLSAGLLAAGCAASSTGSTAAGAPAGGSSASSAGASGASGGASSGGSSSSSSTGGSGAGTASAAASPSGDAASSPANTGTPACTSAHLTASIGGGAGAGMSQNHVGLNFRNTGSTACTLYGYPGVSWVRGSQGLQTGEPAVRQSDPGGTERVVTLAPGAIASAPLDIVDAAVISPSQCKPVPVRGLRIYPPGSKDALFLPLPTRSGGYGECSLPTKAPTLLIGYLEAGTQPGGGDQG